MVPLNITYLNHFHTQTQKIFITNQLNQYFTNNFHSYLCLQKINFIPQYSNSINLSKNTKIPQTI